MSDQKAREAAAEAISRRSISNFGVPYPMVVCREDANAAVDAYLAALTLPEDVREVVERATAHAAVLRATAAGASDNFMVAEADIVSGDITAMADLLTAQALRLAEAERERDEATADRDRYLAIAEDKLAGTRLVSAGARGDGEFGFDLMGGPIPFITEYLFQFIGARTDKPMDNYAQIEVTHNEFGPMTLTLQRHSGKTPHQLKAEAEARADALAAENARLREALNIAASRGCDHCADSIRRARATLKEEQE